LFLKYELLNFRLAAKKFVLPPKNSSCRQKKRFAAKKFILPPKNLFRRQKIHLAAVVNANITYFL